MSNKDIVLKILHVKTHNVDPFCIFLWFALKNDAADRDISIQDEVTIL